MHIIVLFVRGQTFYAQHTQYMQSFTSDGGQHLVEESPHHGILYTCSLAHPVHILKSERTKRSTKRAIKDVDIHVG